MKRTKSQSWLNSEKRKAKAVFHPLKNERFSPKSVVKLKNEQKHIVSESMMKKNLSGGGWKWLKQPLRK
jgi:hypothetical protein